MTELEPAGATTKNGAPEKYYVRFTREQRYMHAALFTSFLGLAATGLPMRFSESFWARTGLPPPWADSEASSFCTSSLPWC